MGEPEIFGITAARPVIQVDLILVTQFQSLPAPCTRGKTPQDPGVHRLADTRVTATVTNAHARGPGSRQRTGGQDPFATEKLSGV